ncbi:MAG: hypothetical protein KBD27_01375 [Candidatus Moranbacteria bacterium]|nr:hypothetical protein [Candidatus Moranbacteria bacterium]
MQTKLEVMWEIVQSTVIPFIMGRFMGGGAHKTPATDAGARPDEPLKQQTTSLLSHRNDEAIQFAVDAAIRKLSGGKRHIQNIQAVRVALESHQQADWRKYLGALVLTERFEHVMASETITRGGRGSQQQAGAAAQPGQGGQEKIERKFERRPLDYELTADDPRVQHLVLISQIVSTEADEKDGVAKAKDYLLSAGLISRQSPAQRVTAAKDATVRGLYQSALEKPARDEVQRREQTIEGTKNPATRKRLERELEAYTVTQARVADTKAKGRLLTALGGFAGFLAFLFIVGLIIAANLK